MSDPVTRLVEAIDRKDARGIRDVYAPAARLVAMTPNTFQVAVGADDVAAKLAEFLASWEEEPSYSFLGTVRDGDRAAIEFERVSTFEGAPWVVRQAHLVAAGRRGHRGAPHVLLRPPGGRAGAGRRVRGDGVVSAGALDGLRVIDLTHHLGGPLATMALAQIGADVIKVEPPDGDQWRHVDDVARREPRVPRGQPRTSGASCSTSRRPRAATRCTRLVAGADVVVHSFAPGVAERLGAGAEELTALNPRLVHCSLSAFGPAGAARHRRRAPVRVGPRDGERRAHGARAGARH